MFRAASEAFGQLCFDISQGKSLERALDHLFDTPGGGKSLLPVYRG
jgi:hypothetical protein